ncbi:MAG: site-2 protease family protein [Eggerthellaceae bacterium]|nr:site-2 protease family protein [Eggerthellaceae bacterium]
MTWETLLIYAIEILCFIPALVLHEVAHGYVAYKLGDPTAKSSGRLSLNPIKHIDIFGTVILPLGLMLMGGPIFGYAKPVPYNPVYFKNIRRDDFLVGIAGPLTNLALALFAALLQWLIYRLFFDAVISSVFMQYVFFIVLPYFAIINLFLMFFNLLPIPPLDGSSIFALLLPIKYLPQYYRVQQYALPIFLVLMLVVPYVFSFSPIGWYLDATAGQISQWIMVFSL